MFEREYMHFVEWTNNQTHAIENIHNDLPPTIKFMIDTYGDQTSSAAIIGSSFITTLLAFVFFCN